MDDDVAVVSVLQVCSLLDKVHSLLELHCQPADLDKLQAFLLGYLSCKYIGIKLPREKI